MSEKSKTKEVLQLSVAYGTLSPCFIRYLKVSLQNGKTAWKKIVQNIYWIYITNELRPLHFF